MDAAGEAPRAVLFLCGYNIIRSPMAAALAGQMFGGTLRVESAGVRKEESDPFVPAVMNELGIDLARHKPKTLEELVEYEDFDFDLIISLSPEAHHAALEFTRHHPVEVEYWPTEDPTLRRLTVPVTPRPLSRVRSPTPAPGPKARVWRSRRA